MNSLRYYYTEFIYQVKCTINFFKNVWRFRKPLYEFRWWDYHSLLQFMQIAIEHMEDKTKTKSTEVDSTRIPKAAKMERASEILKNQLDNYVYMDMAEEKCGELIHRDGDFIPLDSDGNSFTYEDNLTDEERKHNGEVFAYSAELEKKEWEEFCSIIKDKKTGLKSWWD